MADDPRRVLVEAVARLGRETQIHLDERHRHFWVTNLVILSISVMLVIIAVFNVYYIRVLYQDLNGIVFNMDSMHENLRHVKGSMLDITQRIESFDQHVGYMGKITENTASMSGALPRIGGAMRSMNGQVAGIKNEMAVLRGGMLNIDQRVLHMTGSVASMRENVRQIAKPMGMMNPFMP
ncbi:MAG: translation initiation factor 2 [Gammaproteobacteria bacterium]|nr:translation initiation factor 2 [Gammaproteobacteria bacterium]